MHRVAQGWLVLELTGNAVLLGLITALQFAPMLVVSPWAGSLADRRSPRKVLLVTQSTLAVQAFVLAGLVLAGVVTTFWLAAFALLLGVSKAIDAPARQTMVSDLVQRAMVPNAVALNSASFNLARLIGPALAGVLIAAWGTGLVFMLNAVSFFAFLSALLLIRIAAPSHNCRTGGVRDGVRYVISRPDLLAVIAVSGIVSMFVLNFQMTIAIMATQEYGVGAEVYGLLASTMAIGALTGSLIAARRGRTSVRLVFGSAAALAGLTVVAGLMPTPQLFATSLVATGAAALTMMTGANAYLQTHAGPDHRGRVMALYLAIFFGTTPIGAPIAGWLAAVFGGRWALIVPGLLALLAVAVLSCWFHRVGARKATVLVSKPESAKLADTVTAAVMR
jgi:MFS family permease